MFFLGPACHHANVILKKKPRYLNDIESLPFDAFPLEPSKNRTDFEYPVRTIPILQDTEQNYLIEEVESPSSD